MEAMNINKYSRGDDRESNYRLLTAPSRAEEIARLEGELARLMEMVKQGGK